MREITQNEKTEISLSAPPINLGCAANYMKGGGAEQW